jgi:ABC-2 type transport system permease protein
MAVTTNRTSLVSRVRRLRSITALALLALALGMLGASPYFNEDASQILFFAAWCAAILLIFTLALRLPTRLGGGRIRAVLLNASVLVAAIAVALLANVAVHRHDVHLDLSREGINSPPEQIVALLKELHTDLSVTYFYNSGDGNALSAKSLLTVAARQNPRFRFRAVDLDREPALARRLGVHAYNSAVLQAENRQVIVENTVDLAQIAYAALRVLKQRVEVVCYITGHGESFPESQAHFHFSHLETLRGHNVPGASDVLVGEADGVDRLHLAVATLGYTIRRIVADIGPRRAFAPGEARLLESYLARGGRMLLMIDPGFPIEGDLAAFLAKLGLASDQAVVVDPLNHYASDSDKVAVPYYPPHPITKRVAMTIFPEARPLRLRQPPAGVTASVLASSSNDSYLRQLPAAMGGAETPPPESTARTTGPAVLALALEGRWPEASASEAKPFRLVVVGNSNFVTNAYFPYVSNGDLAVGMVRWLAGDEAMPPVRPQSFSPDQIILTGDQMRGIFIALELLLPLSVILFGGVVWWRRR